MEPYTYKGWTIFDKKWFVTHHCKEDGRANWTIFTSKRLFYCSNCGTTASTDISDHLNAVINLVERTGLDKDAKP